jgi:HEAT repeat protein
VETLIAALKDHPDQLVRESVASSLGLTRDSRAFEPLIVALGDSQPGLRRRATLGLSLLGDERAIPALEALAARETNVAVVEAAREAIENIRGANAQAHPGNDEKPKPAGR